MYQYYYAGVQNGFSWLLKPYR